MKSIRETVTLFALSFAIATALPVLAFAAEGPASDDALAGACETIAQDQAGGLANEQGSATAHAAAGQAVSEDAGTQAPENAAPAATNAESLVQAEQPEGSAVPADNAGATTPEPADAHGTAAGDAPADAGNAADASAGGSAGAGAAAAGNTSNGAPATAGNSTESATAGAAAAGTATVVASSAKASTTAVKAASASTTAKSTASTTAAKSTAAAKSASSAAGTTLKAASSSTAAALKLNHVFLIRPMSALATALAAGYGSNGASVNAQKFTGDSLQQWKLIQAGTNLYAFVNVASGCRLDVSGAKRQAGTPTLVWEANSGANQKWKLVKNEDGSYAIVTALGGNLRLSASGKLVAASSSAAQYWDFYDITDMRARLDKQAAATKGKVKAGTYVITPNKSSVRVLDVQGASKANGANVDVSTPTMGAHQLWTIAFDKKGYATIRVGSGKMLDVAGGSASAGTNVLLWEANGGLNQKWIITPNADGTWRIASALWASRSLYTASFAKGANVRLAKSSTSAKQRWTAYSNASAKPTTSTVANGWYTLRSALSTSTAQSKAFFLDVTGEKAANGTPLELYAGNGGPAQIFRIYKSGTYYRIESAVCSNFNLDVRNGCPIPGTIGQIKKVNANETLFALKKNANGSYQFVNVKTGLALDASAGKAVNGAAITAQKYEANKASQSFYLAARHGLVDAGYYRISTTLSGGRALSVRGEKLTAGAAAELQDSYGALHQKWRVVAVSGKSNTYAIESLWSGMRLAGKKYGAVTQAKSAAANAQYWTPTKLARGVVWTNVATGQPLDVDGASSKAGTSTLCWDYSGAKNQQWAMEKVTPIETGVYEISPAASQALALAVQGSSTEGGANVQLQSDNSTTSQKWYYDAQKGTLMNMASGLVLDVSGASNASGSNVIQWHANEEPNQLWTFAYAGGGTFEIASRLGNNLALSAASAKSGANVSNKTYSKASTQRWRMAKQKTVLANQVKNSLAGISMANVRAVGIDVSFWNGDINWAAVKAAGIDFAILRAGYGKTVTDSQFANYVKGCRANGIPFGVYYYSTAKSASEARDEANRTLSIMKSAGVTSSNLDYAVYLDLEEPDMASTSNRALLASITNAFLTTISNQGYRGGVYSSTSWWDNYLTYPEFNKWERWVAHWGVSTCGYKGTYKIWQCSSDGSVPGINGRVDMDFLY